ncbi:MAG: lipid II flippase MurJ [Chloroflexota bacterium]|jgi:putative peptidoglycan lipid II flippase
MNPEAQPAHDARGSFLRRSALLNGLFISEGLGNFLLDATLAAVLGLGVRSDVLYAAWSLPMTIGRGMFQSLTNSFMGYYAAEDNLKQAYNHSITLIGLLGIGLTLVFYLSAKWWYPLTILGGSPEEKSAGTPLAAILSMLIGLFALSETMRAVYYREGNMFIPSASRLFGILFSIAIVLTTSSNNDLSLVSWGLVAGAGVELLLNWLGLRWSIQVRYRPNFPARKQLRAIIGIVGLPLAGQALRVLAGAVERSLASLLGPGILTAVAFSSRIILTIERFVFRGFLITTIESYTSGKVMNIKAQFRLIVLIGMILSIIIAVLAYPLVEIAFGRGRFTSRDVELLSSMLRYYVPAIFLLAITRLPLGLAYAKRQGRVVFGYFMLVSFILVGLEALLIALGFGIYLFGISYAIALTAAFVWLYQLSVKPELAQRESSVLFPPKDLVKIVCVGLFSFLGTVLTVHALDSLLFAGRWTSYAQLAIGLIASVGFFLLGSWILHLEEIQWLLRHFKAGNQL